MTHTPHFINTVSNNDYPTSITHFNKKSQKLHTPFNTYFLKLPHFSEIITKKIRRAIYKEGLDIQLAHSGPSQRQRIKHVHKPTAQKEIQIYAKKKITLFIV